MCASEFYLPEKNSKTARCPCLTSVEQISRVARCPDHSKTSQAAFSNALNINGVSIYTDFLSRQTRFIRNSTSGSRFLRFLVLPKEHTATWELLDRIPCPVIHKMEIWHHMPVTFASVAVQAAKSHMPLGCSQATPTGM